MRQPKQPKQKAAPKSKTINEDFSKSIKVKEVDNTRTNVFYN
jgi:hypothetical protein